MIDGKTKIAGLIGTNISLSKSYAIHNNAFLHNKINAKYIPLQTTLEFLPAVLNGIRGLPFMGANVTMPFKKVVINYLDKLTDTAKTIGAVNTIFSDKGELIGDNTDGSGFVSSAIEHNIILSGRPVYIYGAGGSARAISYALAKQGVINFFYCNRTIKHIDEIQNMLQKHNKNIIVERFSKVMHCDALIINTTPVGSVYNNTDEMIWPVNETFKTTQTVIDIIYEPPETPLIIKAKKEGAETLNGLPMLIHQAAESFSIWTKSAPPLEVMKQALL
jgi:shikimate dehydrogenase